MSIIAAALPAEAPVTVPVVVDHDKMSVDIDDKAVPFALHIETVPEAKMEDTKMDESHDVESGYASASSEYAPSPEAEADTDAVSSEPASTSPSESSSSPSSSPSSSQPPRITLTPSHLAHLNAQLESLAPVDILRFSLLMFPSLYQTTSFGPSGLVTLDMLSKLQAESQHDPVPLIFLDTLYHFPETHDLVSTIRERYPAVPLHTFKPLGADTAAQFEELYGPNLYETQAELYDWTAKVEPLQRAYSTLGVVAVLTGRRRSQGGARDAIPVIEMDEDSGVIKINPMLNWSFAQVQAYIRENDVPYNALMDRGYKSIGDWHSTSPVAEGESERAGRWKGQEKTECGIHNKKSRYAQFLADMARKEQEAQAEAEEQAGAAADTGAEGAGEETQTQIEEQKAVELVAVAAA